MAIDAVIFDMDGVLIDTEQLWDEVRKDFTLEHGGRWHDGVQQALMGMASIEWTVYMIEELGVDLTAEEINAGMVERLLQRHAEHLTVMPGAVECVRALSTRWPMAVASSSNKELIESALNRLDIRQCFVDTVASDEAGAGKPDPAVYLEAAKRVGIDAGNCLAIEDSSNGIKAAVAAGMTVIAVPTKDFPPSPEALAMPDLVLGSLIELTPELVESL